MLWVGRFSAWSLWLLVLLLSSAQAAAQGVPESHAGGLSRAALSGGGPLAVPAARGAEVPLKRGVFLVASRAMEDPNFHQSVLLLIEYGRHGAMGLIVNRPTAVRIEEALPEMKGLRNPQDLLYGGGPVAPHQIMMLIRSGGDLERALRVFGDVHFSTSEELLGQMVEQPGSVLEFRLYAGHAGWSPGQLDHEVAIGGWHVLPAESDAVFHRDPQELWPELIRRTLGRWVGKPDALRASLSGPQHVP